MTDREAMKMALEALNKRINGDFDGSTYTDIEYMASEALRTALEQPEQNDKRFVNGGLPMGGMGFKVVNEVAQSEPYADRKREIELFSNGRINVDAVTGDIGIGTIAQPEQEPVVFKDAPQRIYLQVCQDDECEVPFSEHSDVSWCEDKINEIDIPYIRADLYTAPPKREWVGLTDEEIDDLDNFDYDGYSFPNNFARAIEAKLKEKNT